MITWNVYKRELYIGSSSTVLNVEQVAICATKDQALDEVRRLTEAHMPAVWCPQRGSPEHESPTYYVKQGSTTIGLVALP